jgi:mRNA interferase MazF
LRRRHRRGDVYYFDPDPVVGSEQAGRRPAVVISRDSINSTSTVLVVIPISTYRGRRLYSSEVLIEAPEGGLSRDSVALADHVRAVGIERLHNRIGSVEDETLEAIEKALCHVLKIRPGILEDDEA